MASQSVIAVFEEPTADERTLGLLAHRLMAFTGIIGPLLIFCVKQDSRFVKFHSLQALECYLHSVAVCRHGHVLRGDLFRRGL
jgi:uncharacterized Tic20 family protein